MPVITSLHKMCSCSHNSQPLGSIYILVLFLPTSEKIIAAQIVSRTCHNNLLSPISSMLLLSKMSTVTTVGYKNFLEIELWV